MRTIHKVVDDHQPAAMPSHGLLPAIVDAVVIDNRPVNGAAQRQRSFGIAILVQT